MFCAQTAAAISATFLTTARSRRVCATASIPLRLILAMGRMRRRGRRRRRNNFSWEREPQTRAPSSYVGGCAENPPLAAISHHQKSGGGSKKARDFGPLFLAEIAAHLQTNPRQIFGDD